MEDLLYDLINIDDDRGDLAEFNILDIYIKIFSNNKYVLIDSYEINKLLT